ncbi:MAG: radical SAM protein [Candidatus Pelagibacter sp.]|nr:radical SAM protein [Candidatus Pelagibacter sp.]|tara:strand:- start:30300 stop:31490 length:1191 start_codon:yes stop_codon:yes gene_type:complete
MAVAIIKILDKKIYMKLNFYKKHNSFVNFSVKEKDKKDKITKRIISLIQNSDLENFSLEHKKILSNVKNDLLNKNNEISNEIFDLKDNVIDELLTFEEKDILKYLVHRYRYEIFPIKKIIDDYPPYLQIEPSSICNYRCTFCFMTDKSLTNKKNGHMGQMNLELFKKIIDAAENRVEFISLASRGEPMACEEIGEMLEYTVGKFLNLKINTNASLLNEQKIHAILSGGVKTLVISADAADAESYKRLRVNGNLKKVLKNLELFNNIKEKNYSSSKIITRVSGVKVSDEQKFNDMEKLWGGLVDQVAFVNYNPWENSYEKESNNIIQPCSDLWRRMFIWWDGKVNPCDVDYKSKLSVSFFNDDIKSLWNSNGYENLRAIHIDKKRSHLKPCNACIVV